MDITTLLLSLGDNDAVCATDGAILRVKIPETCWTDALREAVAEHKSVLIRFLTLAPGQTIPAETLLGWCDTYEERAAILEYGAGLSREDAERQAWQMLRETLHAAS